MPSPRLYLTHRSSPAPDPSYVPPDSLCNATPTVLYVCVTKVGEHTLELFLMCDSYVGCDQEYAVELMVGAAGSDDESEED